MGCMLFIRLNLLVCFQRLCHFTKTKMPYLHFMKRVYTILILLLFGINAFGQVDPENISIVRDEWGIPHIYTQTDAEAAYAIAWVQAEDNFKMLQQILLFGRGELGTVLGKKGAQADFFAGLLGMDELVDSLMAKDVSPAFKTYLEGFCQGLNDFAKKYPEEVIGKNLFPVYPKDVLVTYPLKIADFIGLSKIVGDIIEGKKWDEESSKVNFVKKGSNAFAFQQKMTKNGKTYLVGNPHVALEGPESFYELQVNSEEGIQFHGALFPGAVTPQVGTTPNLGWSHTNNYYDHTDVYLLKMHPTKKGFYEFDGEWLSLVEKELKLRVKTKAGIISVKRTVYRSVYGPTIESKDGNFFAVRMAPILGIKSAEQWYKMVKAQNLVEFKEALQFNGLPYFNITYADKSDNVFYIFNGLFPERKAGYDWTGLLPGNTSETLWTTYVPFNKRPQIENPACGFVYNVNHSPFKCTGPSNWLNPDDYDPNVNYNGLTDDLPRSLRFREIYQEGTKLSMEQLKAIKYDVTLPKTDPTTAAIRQLRNTTIDDKYQVMVDTLLAWNYKANPMSSAPTIAYLYFEGLKKNDWDLRKRTEEVPEEKVKQALKFAYNHLMKYFGTIDVPYSDFAVFKRGEKVIHAYGIRGTLGARWGKLSEKDGKFYATGGDNFMFFAQYDETGLVTLETIVPNGSSNETDSEYYNNQLELYGAKKTKVMSFDENIVKKNASRIYSPLD